MQVLENIWKMWEKNRDIKLAMTERRRKYFAPEPNYYTKTFFTKNLLAIEIKKIEILLNKSVSLGLSILELSKILMYEFSYDYVKPKYGKKAQKLCYMDTDSFLVYIKTDDKDIPEDVLTRLDTSNYELDRPLPKEKKQKCNCIKERWTRWKNHEKVCWIKVMKMKKQRKAQKSVS